MKGAGPFLGLLAAFVLLLTVTMSLVVNRVFGLGWQLAFGAPCGLSASR